MKTREWLEKEVAKLAALIAGHPVFVSSEPASDDDLSELQKLLVIHRFFELQLLEIQSRRSPRSGSDRFAA